MAFVRIITPRDVTWEHYDRVDARIKEGGPVEGLIVHAAVDNDGRPQFIEVWESQQHADRFGEERIGPAMAEVAPDVAGPPEPDQMEIYEIRSMTVGTGSMQAAS